AGGRSAHPVLVSRQHGPVDAAVTVHERAVCPGLVVTLDHQPGHAVVGTELAAHGDGGVGMHLGPRPGLLTDPVHEAAGEQEVGDDRDARCPETAAAVEPV